MLHSGSCICGKRTCICWSLVVFVGCISAGILSEVGRAVRLPWFSVNQKMRYSPAFHIINPQSFLPTILNIQPVLQKIIETLPTALRAQALTVFTGFANSAYLAYFHILHILYFLHILHILHILYTLHILHILHILYILHIYVASQLFSDWHA